MLKIGILASGGGTNLQAIIDGVKSGIITNTTIEVVISNNPGAYALQRAKDNQIAAVCISPKTFDTRAEYNAALITGIDEYQLDLIVLAGCMVVLPPELIQKYENRIINIHPALIPSFCGTGYYGLRVHEAVLKRGVKLTGATVHFVDEGTDTGPIILQKAVEVRNGDTAEILQKRVMTEAEWKIMPQAINLIANGKVKIEDGTVMINE